MPTDIQLPTVQAVLKRILIRRDATAETGPVSPADRAYIRAAIKADSKLEARDAGFLAQGILVAMMAARGLQLPE
jgi:hypothetical protein